MGNGSFCFFIEKHVKPFLLISLKFCCPKALVVVDDYRKYQMHTWVKDHQSSSTSTSPGVRKDCLQIMEYTLF